MTRHVPTVVLCFARSHPLSPSPFHFVAASRTSRRRFPVSHTRTLDSPLLHLPEIDLHSHLLGRCAALGVSQDDLSFHQRAAADEGVILTSLTARVPAILGQVLDELRCQFSPQIC